MRTWLKRGTTLQTGITTCCLIAFVLFGYDQGVFSGALQSDDWQQQFGYPSDSRTGIIVSCYNLGCLAGCVVSFFVGETLGRRKTIWLAMCIVIIGAILQSTAFTLPHLIIGRVITGLGTGLETSTVPAYQAELCDRRARGRLVASEILFVAIGVVVAYWFNFGMSYVGGSITWRLPLALQTVFAITAVVLVFALPESPRWLHQHGQPTEATEVLCAVYDMQPDDEYIVAETAAILSAIELEQQAVQSTSIFDKDEVRTRYRIFLAWGMQFMNQASGINLIVYYIPSVLVQNVGKSPHQAQILAGLINTVFAVGSIIPTITMDRIGRRASMMWGSIGMAMSMLLIAILLSQSRASEDGQRATASAAVAFFFLYMFLFGAAVNCVPWVYVSEILPLKARTRGAAIGVSSNWLWNFTVVMITPVLINRIGWKAYLIFAATNLLFVPIVYFLYPETTNIRLEDIDRLFIDGVNPVTAARQIALESEHGVTFPAEKTDLA